jgi:hypothetical protein
VAADGIKIELLKQEKRQTENLPAPADRISITYENRPLVTRQDQKMSPETVL